MLFILIIPVVCIFGGDSYILCTVWILPDQKHEHGTTGLALRGNHHFLTELFPTCLRWAEPRSTVPSGVVGSNPILRQGEHITDQEQSLLSVFAMSMCLGFCFPSCHKSAAAIQVQIYVHLLSSKAMQDGFKMLNCTIGPHLTYKRKAKTTRYKSLGIRMLPKAECIALIECEHRTILVLKTSL